MNTSDALDAALSEARQNYIDKRPLSLASFEEATQYMPGGNTRTVLFHEPFPFRAARGEGAVLTDVDGHQYVNFLGEYTAGIFGHSHPKIRAAIEAALDGGVNLGAHNEYEPKLARLVCDRFASIERVRFTNSGTEANLMAISTCRVQTGREKVMVFDGGYHGGLLYFGHGGIPINAPFPYVLANYNDIEGTRALLKEHGQDLACVLVEPMMGSGGCIPASSAFIEMLRAETKAAGAILIFDEVMTSRITPGGAQEMFGVTPDMTTLGKYIGGGMSFGAFGGSEEVMGIYDPRRPDAMPHAGTFNNNTLSMRAGCVAMEEIYTPEAAVQLNARGDELRERLNEMARVRGLPVHVTGFGSIMGIHANSTKIESPDDTEKDNHDISELLFLDLLDAGYYIARRGFIALTLVLEAPHYEGFTNALETILDERGPLIAGVME